LCHAHLVILILDRREKRQANVRLAEMRSPVMQVSLRQVKRFSVT